MSRPTCSWCDQPIPEHCTPVHGSRGMLVTDGKRVHRLPGNAPAHVPTKPAAKPVAQEAAVGSEDTVPEAVKPVIQMVVIVIRPIEIEQSNPAEETQIEINEETK